MEARVKSKVAIVKVTLGVLAGLPMQAAFTQSDCKHRGDLDANYCDENHDLVAEIVVTAVRKRIL